MLPLLWGLQKREDYSPPIPDPRRHGPLPPSPLEGSLGPGCRYPGWSCGSSEGQGLGPGGETQCHWIISSTLPSSLPSPSGYLGQLPLNRGVLWLVEIWFPALVLQPYPLWTQGWSGPPAQSPGWYQGWSTGCSAERHGVCCALVLRGCPSEEAQGGNDRGCLGLSASGVLLTCS